MIVLFSLRVEDVDKMFTLKNFKIKIKRVIEIFNYNSLN